MIVKALKRAESEEFQEEEDFSLRQVAKVRIPEADVKSVRLFLFLHIFHRTAMFIDGAAAAYKSN